MQSSVARVLKNLRAAYVERLLSERFHDGLASYRENLSNRFALAEANPTLSLIELFKYSFIGFS